MTLTPSPLASRYNVIYADPPWSFRTYSAKGKGRAPDAHYECMDENALKALPVTNWAAPDCVLLLWATDPLLPLAFHIITAWGFTYKTVGFYWAKLNKRADRERFDKSSFFTGLGFWTRANPELCLLATRGNPQRRDAGVRKLLVAPRREHSRKPEEIYERIERLCDGPYLELFARSDRAGWDSWGRQAGLFTDGSNTGPVLTRRWKSDLTHEKKS